MVTSLAQVSQDVQDCVLWNLYNTGAFSVKSSYKAAARQHIRECGDEGAATKAWKVLPLPTAQVFLWLLLLEKFYGTWCDADLIAILRKAWTCLFDVVS